MKVKELIEELQKYPEDTQILIEWYDDSFWITHLEEPWLDFHEEIKYNQEFWDMWYANSLRYDWILNNILTIK